MLKTLKRTPKALMLLIPLTMVLSLGMFFAPAPAYAAGEFVVTKGGTPLAGSPFNTLQAAVSAVDTDGAAATYVITCAKDDEIATAIVLDDTDPMDITIKSDSSTVRNFTLASSLTARHLNFGASSGNVSLTLENINLTGHGSSKLGGGIVIGATGQPASELILKNSTIQNCVGNDSGTGNGGGISLENADLTMHDGSAIIECYAAIGANDGFGGGIYGDETTVTLETGSVIRDCVASLEQEGNGGGIYLDDGTNTLVLDGGSIMNNTGSKNKGFVGFAGGVRIGAGNTFEMKDGSSIIGNLASKGDGGQGGGIYINDPSATTTMTGGTIEFNLASDREDGEGGGVYTESDFGINGGTILSNTASKGSGGLGGGIYAEGAAVITLSGTKANPSNIIGNDASGDGGGGIYLDQTAKLITTGHVEFSKNLAVNGEGGAIYTEDDTVYLNVETSAATLFKNNGAEKAYAYDGDGAVEFPKLKFSGVSIHFPGSSDIEDQDHVLNNFDINFTDGDEFDPFIHIFLDVLTD